MNDEQCQYYFDSLRFPWQKCMSVLIASVVCTCKCMLFPSNNLTYLKQIHLHKESDKGMWTYFILGRESSLRSLFIFELFSNTYTEKDKNSHITFLITLNHILVQCSFLNDLQIHYTEKEKQKSHNVLDNTKPHFYTRFIWAVCLC